MDATNIGNLNEDAQQASLLEEAIDARIHDAMLDVHTALPGKLVSYDAATNTASVQLAVNRYFLVQGWVKIPLCVDVPVKLLRGGPWSITLPFQPGDECLVVFSERDIDGWFQQGEQQNPIDPRMHSFSDAFAFVGFNSSKSSIPNVTPNALEIRNTAKSTKITLTDNDVVIQGDISITMKDSTGSTSLTLSDGTITIQGNVIVHGTVTQGV